jgi:hypothetical protein
MIGARARVIAGGLMCSFVPVVRVAINHPNFEFDIGGKPFERIVQRDHFSQRDAFAVLR